MKLRVLKKEEGGEYLVELRDYQLLKADSAMRKLVYHAFKKEMF
jgi:hypothetical protein